MLLSVVNALAQDADVIEIGTVEQLKTFRDAVNNGNNYSGKTVKLTADLDLQGENWTPIGSLAADPVLAFYGIFDGNNHTISHLTINQSGNVGLFYHLNTTIKNLTLTDVNITGTYQTGAFAAYCSGLGTIENCHVNGGTITSTPVLNNEGKYDDGNNVGGIIGYMDSSVSKWATTASSIKDCSVKNVTIRAYRRVGGIAGMAQTSSAENGETTSITGCTVENVTILQDNTHNYKNYTQDSEYKIGELVGQEGVIIKEGNTTSNVTILMDQKFDETTYVAQIGNEKYASLEAAFAAAQDGETITLLDNCAGNGIIAEENTFTTGLTVDFGGFTYTVDGTTLAGSTGTKNQAFQLKKGNKITFKNGAIVGNTADVKMLIQNYSDLTLDGMTLNANQGTNSVNYVLSTNNGNTVIKNTTITAKANGKAFDVDSGWGNYQSNSVELTGTSVINGDIEVAFEGKTAGTPSVLTLTSGTLNGNIVMGTGADQCTVTKAADFVAAAPAGYEWKDNGDGTSTLAEIVPVAQIGSVKYASLAEAIAAVPTDGTETTITMLADESIEGNAGLTIAKTQNIVLDLNGKTIQNLVNENKASQVFKNNGTLSIKDSAGNGVIKNNVKEGTQAGEWWSTPQYNYATNVILNGGTLNIYSGTIEQTAAGSICYAVDNNSNGVDAILNVEGGNLTSVRTVVRQFCNSTTKQNVLNISGGIIETAGKTGIWTQLPGSQGQKKLATINITGGEITGGEYAWYDYSYGDSFEAVSYSISGGNFNGELYSYAITGEVISGFISGGTYSVEPAAAYVADGYYVVDNNDGTWTVKAIEYTNDVEENGAVVTTETATITNGEATITNVEIAQEGVKNVTVSAAINSADVTEIAEGAFASLAESAVQTIDLSSTQVALEGKRSENKVLKDIPETALIYLPSTSSTVTGTNVVIKDAEKEEYTCESLLIVNKKDYSVPTPFKAETATFQREFTTNVTSTLCLPYDVPAENINGKIYSFDSIDPEVPSITMTEVTGGLKANVPYIFKPTSEIESITASEIEVMIDEDNAKATKGNFTLVGVFEKKVFTADECNTGVYGYAANNNPDGLHPGQFSKGGIGAYVPGMRAYLMYTGGDVSLAPGLNGAPAATSLPNKINVILKDANGETTEILNLDMETAEDGTPVYNLSGQRVNNAEKGIYIKNGKKVIIK